jgi:hypothetical protein
LEQAEPQQFFHLHQPQMVIILFFLQLHLLAVAVAEQTLLVY